MKRVNITETVLRDANQSLIATRLPFSDFEEVLEKIDQAGYYSIECWGGATLTHASGIFRKIPGKGSEGLRRKLKTPSSRCF